MFLNKTEELYNVMGSCSPKHIKVVVPVLVSMAKLEIIRQA